MSLYASAASQEKLNADPREPHRPGVILGLRPLARPLVPVTLALMAGIAAPAWGLRLPEPWLLAAAVALWAALALLWWQRRPARFLPLILFGLLGVAFYQQAWQPDFPPAHLTKLPQNQNLTLFGHLNRPGKLGAGREQLGMEEPKEEDKDDWVQFGRLEPEEKYKEGRVQLFMAAGAWRSPWGWRPASGNLLVLAPVPEPPPVGTGLVIRGRLRRPAMVQDPGTFNRPRYLAADGIFREVRLSDPDHLIFLAETQDYPWAERLRGGIRELLKSMDPAGRAIYLAMLLGDQGEITQAMRQNFARTGTSHLLVINGLHLGMVAVVTYFLSFWLLRRFPRLLLRVNAVKIATLLAAIPVVFYAWVAGGSPSTQRAEVMVLAYLLAGLPGAPRRGLERPGPGGPHYPEPLAPAPLCYLLPALLCGGGLLDLPAAPVGPDHRRSRNQTPTSRAPPPSFPESKSGLRKRNQLTPSAPRRPPAFRITEWFMVSVVATLATAPLVAFYFQVVSLLGILVNLVAIPLVLILALPLGEAAVIAQTLSLTLVAQVLLFVGNIPLWLGYQAVQWGAEIPGSAITTPTPTWLMIAAYYAVLILVFYPRRTFLTWAGAGLAGLVLVVAIAVALAPGHGPQVPGSDLSGRLQGARGGGGDPGEPAPGGVRGGASPVGPARPGLGAAAGIPALAAVPEPGPGHRLEPERGQRRGTAHPGPAVQRRVILVRPAGPGRGGLLGPGQLPGRPGRHAAVPGAGPAPGRSGRRGLAVRQTGPGCGSGPGSRLSRPAGPAAAAGEGAGG